MGVKYSIRLAKNLHCPDEPGLHYPQIQTKEKINIYCIAKEIGSSTLFTKTDVLNIS